MTFEQKGLRLAAAFSLIGAGLVTAASAWAPLSGPMGAVLDTVFWPMDAGQGAGAEETRLLLAILGGITFGWGLMIWQLAGAPLQRMPDVVRPIIGRSILGWFLVDSTASFLAGAPWNVAANVGFAALFLIPLASGQRRRLA
jgi:hypothetical protein